MTVEVTARQTMATKTKRSRAAGVEWTAETSDVAHGAPLLVNGHLQAAYRDASWFARPDVRTDKQAHVVVWSRRLGLSSGNAMGSEAAACDPTRIMLDVEGLCRDAANSPSQVRCRRGGCARLFAQADREANRA